MVQIRRILCPLDFSDFSQRALDHAVAIARWYKARLTVMYVHQVPLATLASAPLLAPAPADAVALSLADRESLQRRLQALLPRGDGPDIPIDCHIVEGDVAAEILAAAALADVLVIGTHGRSGFERLVLGSIAERLLRQAPCPLLIVPRAAPEAATVPRLFHHIVAAVDFSPASAHAAAFATSLAEEADAHLTLVHALDLPPAVEAWMVETGAGHSRLQQWRHGALARLHDLVPDDVRTYCHVEERVETDAASRVILAVAAERHAGLIVVGAHGGGPLERMFVGSTAQRVVRQATCPVLIVRAIESAAGTAP